MLSLYLGYERASIPIARRRALCIAVVGLALTTTGCLRVPVGDPEQSVMDPKLTGIWSGEGTSIVQAYDKRTYFVQNLRFEVNQGKKVLKSVRSYKAWLTTLGDERFITLQPLLFDAKRKPGSDVGFAVGRMREKNGVLAIWWTNDDSSLLKHVTSREQAEQIIKNNINNQQLYRGEPMEFKKADGEDLDEIQAALTAAGIG